MFLPALLLVIEQEGVGILEGNLIGFGMACYNLMQTGMNTIYENHLGRSICLEVYFTRTEGVSKT